MAVKIEVSGSDLPEIVDALGGVHLGTVNKLREESAYHRGERDALQLAFNDLANRYDACAAVRDNNAAQLSLAIEQNDRLTGDIKVCDEHIAHLKKEVANLTNTSSVLGHSDEEVQIMRNDSYAKGRNDGYERGKSEQMAEHAAELVNRKPHIADMLAHECVAIQVRKGTPFNFKPWRIVRYGAYLLTDGMGTQKNRYPDNHVGIVGQSQVSGATMFFSPDEIEGWKPLALAKGVTTD